jgi:hypothetical protein
MDEIVVNLHMHTRYSDGHSSHAEIAQAALKSGVDAVIVTDHNVWVQGPEDYYKDSARRVLLLVGEEIHDQSRDPQKNHLLVFGARRELATHAHDTQQLLEMVNKAGGLAFIAHLYDPAAPAVGEGDISWEDWNVRGFTGIELWNGMSEFKSLLKTRLHAIYYAFNPKRVAHAPSPQALQKWDELLLKGQRVVAIGGSDAHALPARLGPLHRTLFPYDFHFRCINTHLLTQKPLSGDPLDDGRIILEAMARGSGFIGYDLPAPTRGFRFTAQGKDQTAQMGEEIGAKFGLTFSIRLPRQTECRLLKDGQVVKVWKKRETCTYITSEPGVYRAEVYIEYLGSLRGWIFSNPIYVKE